MHFYRIVQFHIWRRFRASPSVRVYYSGQPIRYAKKLCTNKPDQKIYRCIQKWFTLHYILLHHPTILHMKTFFAPAYHTRKKIFFQTKMPHCSLLHPRAPHTSHSASIYSINLDHLSLS